MQKVGQNNMNREIKFRAWNNKESNPDLKMIYGVVINELGEVCMPDGDWWSLSLMQFTGLKDKNGQEIYEGDIVNGKFDVDKVEDWLWLQLTEKEKRTGEKLFEIKIPDVYQNAMPEEIEVIGNIYENPELLKP